MVSRPKLHKYFDDPVAFIHDCFVFQRGQAPAPYQDEIAGVLPQERRVAVRGPHGLGKTAEAAWIVLWFALTREAEGIDWKIPTTASAWRQLTKFLWPEIHKWARRLKWESLERGAFDPRQELQTLSLKLGSGEAFATASDTPELIEGAHAEQLLYVFDEAKFIPPDIFDAAEGAFATGNCYAFVISTPGAMAGRFYDIHRHAPGYEEWWTRHVTLEEAIAAGRISRAWANARLHQWGEESPVYQARVLGEFPEQAENALVSLAWIEAARERELESTGDPIAGADIARFGDDDSVLFVMQGPCALSADIWHGHNTMTTTGRIKAAGHYTNVDVIGMGSGVYDRLREQEFPCAPINVGEAARDSEHFANLRIELFWLLREMFREGQIDLTRLSREVYDRLSGELTALSYEYTSKGQLKLEPKEETKKRTGHSPDVADAAMLTRAGMRLVRLKDVTSEEEKQPNRWQVQHGREDDRETEDSDTEVSRWRL